MKAALRILTVLAAVTFAATPALAAGAAPAKKRVTASEEFMEMPGLTATITQDYRITGLLQVEAGLDIHDDKLRRKAEALMPRLRDAYATALTAYAGGFYIPGNVPDADRIADMLQAATDRVLGEEGAHLLLGMVVIHDQP